MTRRRVKTNAGAEDFVVMKAQAFGARISDPKVWP